MSKRQTEISFGSDAFLDVIANMVGILIILIVIAGVKASRAPVNVAAPKQPAAETSPGSAAPPAVAAAHDQGAARPQPQVPRPVPAPWPPVEESAPGPAAVEEDLPPVPAAQPPAELVQQAHDLESLLNELQRALSRKGEQAELQRQKRAVAEQELAQVKETAGEAVALLQKRRQDLSEVEAQVLTKKRQLDSLVQQVETQKSERAPVEAIEHRLTPIGRDVHGDEIHFRLADNRVSCVPVMELAALVQKDIERRRDILLSRSFFQGNVGPLNGYRMEYLIQRQTMSLAEELHYGQGVVRLIVTSWVIQPERYLVTESVDEALRTSSRFVQALQQAGPGTTITFWVYPDSFEIHRRLKEIAHETGFRVASRPLPAGVPIAGSPEGSKSVSQ